MRHKAKKSLPRRLLGWRTISVAAGLILLATAGYFTYLTIEVKQRFASRKWSVPSRVFSATVPVYPGQTISFPRMKAMLEERRYKEAVKEPLRAGEFRTDRGRITVHLRTFQFPGHSLPAQRVQFEFHQNSIAKIRGADGELGFLELEPLEIARLFGPQRESRLLISIRQAPKHLIDGILAIEDHRFYDHWGVDWWGISRALWTDLLAGRVLQGGSTITQQLVKNYFLVPERSIRRKLQEVAMALVIEILYRKREILEMYMNEIYLGQRGSVAIHGIGEAARYFFGRNVEDLTLSESATLAGIIRAPNLYSPIDDPGPCRERRNVVLKRMLDLGKITSEEYEKARAEPLNMPGSSLPLNVAPYFVDYVRQQLQELYASEVLESQGLNVYTTLHPEIALAAEDVLAEVLGELENESRKRGGSQECKLHGALIAVQPRTGAVLALVGGKDYSESSFNRALHAHRQPGSAIKPFIYLAALDTMTAVDRVEDEPIPYRVAGKTWIPENHDGKYRGQVFLRTALEDSLNAATVQVADRVGLERIIAYFRDLGIQSRLEPVPSLALGAFEISPLELASAYAVLNNDGQKAYLLSLKEVVSERGEVKERRHVELETVTTPAKAYLITSFLEGAVDRGTGKVLRSMGIDFPCAGKTGTTSDYRDSWFAGYTTDLVVVVWVGCDDNGNMHLTGAQGAARVWGRFFQRIRPWIHPEPFRIPPGVVQRIVCADSGRLAGNSCPQKRLEFFLSDLVPQDLCPVHGK
ncbi:MAG: PBP1A family penicillin-binding protein [Deltaproteobacteria bacterium]|nr:PBP1A family penicillin-binding protein [Deltaproteobacteria bacterium]